MERASLRAPGESRVGMPASPVTRLRGDLICLSLFYGRHLVEEGGLHWQRAGLFIMRYLLSLPDQSLMTPPPTAKGPTYNISADDQKY